MTNLPPGVSLDAVLDAARAQMFGPSLDDPGWCVRCGAEAMGVEPDASGDPCESCGEPGVYGAAEILLHVVP